MLPAAAWAIRHLQVLFLMKRVQMRTAVIGAGRMGRRHIQAVHELGLELIGVADTHPDSLTVAATEREIPREKLFSDPVDLFCATAPELVIVSTTADSHHMITCQAVEAGAKYILCEKPMAVSLAQCDAMIDVCRQHGTRLAINHQIRFSALHRWTKRTLQSKNLGGLCSMTIVAGNFGMAMVGTHMFELFRFVSGEEPHEVAAWLVKDESQNPRGQQFADAGGTIRISTMSGKRFYLESGVDQGHGITIVYAAKYGQIILDLLHGSARILHRQESERNLSSTRYGTTSIKKSVTHAIGDLVDETKAVLHHLLNGGEPPSGNDGRQAIAVLVAAYVSHEKGHTPIYIDDPELPRDRSFPWP